MNPNEIFKVSAKKGTGVSELLNNIITLILQIDLLNNIYVRIIRKYSNSLKAIFNLRKYF